MRLKGIFASVAMLAALEPGKALAVPFDGTNASGKLYICATPQPAALSQAQFEALAWVQIVGLGSHGETGTSSNILTYDTWDQSVVQKYKGLDDAGSPEIELMRYPFDAGQILLRQAATTKFNYAFKLEKPDKQVPTGTGTIVYNRGIVAGPRRPNGRNEVFDLEMFTLGLNQVEIVANPTTAGVAPQNTAIPTITGTATNGNLLTANAGTWTGDATITYTYQWFANGASISGAVNSTYLLTASEVGKKVSVRVTGTNAAGFATGMSVQTATVS